MQKRKHITLGTNKKNTHVELPVIPNLRYVRIQTKELTQHLIKEMKVVYNHNAEKNG